MTSPQPIGAGQVTPQVPMSRPGTDTENLRRSVCVEERTCVGCVEGLYRVKLWFPLGHNTQQASYET